MSLKSHWEAIYSTKSEKEMSWTQALSQTSLQLIEQTGLGSTASVIDVGGGVSHLVDELLKRNYTKLTVLDISKAALDQLKTRLGSHSTQVNLIEADITEVTLPEKYFNVWHDRAVFHFLTTQEQRVQYVNKLKHTLKKGGFAILSTFSLEGPEKCSGLNIVRYNAETLHKELGTDFKLIKQVTETHTTPWNSEQKFIYCLFALV